MGLILSRWKLFMLEAIIDDIVGSCFEFITPPIKHCGSPCCLMTDEYLHYKISSFYFNFSLMRWFSTVFFC